MSRTRKDVHHNSPFGRRINSWMRHFAARLETVDHSCFVLEDKCTALPK